jgi:hypothetical protein
MPSFFFQVGLSRLNRIIAVVALIFEIIYGWKCLFEAQHPPCYIVDHRWASVLN